MSEAQIKKRNEWYEILTNLKDEELWLKKITEETWTLETFVNELVFISHLEGITLEVFEKVAENLSRDLRLFNQDENFLLISKIIKTTLKFNFGRKKRRTTVKGTGVKKIPLKRQKQTEKTKETIKKEPP